MAFIIAGLILLCIQFVYENKILLKEKEKHIEDLKQNNEWLRNFIKEFCKEQEE